MECLAQCWRMVGPQEMLLSLPPGAALRRNLRHWVIHIPKKYTGYPVPWVHPLYNS